MTVQISELSRRTGVPVATVKYYLREGLLPPGRRTAATRAEYDDLHEERLRLVRALVEVAHLPLASVRRVVVALDSPPPERHDLLGTVLGVIADDAGVDEEASATAAPVLERLGWAVHPCSPAAADLGRAMAALEAVGLDAGPDLVAFYGRALQPLARAEVDAVPTTSAEDAVAYVITATLLYEPVILALRRLAHEDASAHRFGQA